MDKEFFAAIDDHLKSAHALACERGRGHITSARTMLRIGGIGPEPSMQEALNFSGMRVLINGRWFQLMSSNVQRTIGNYGEGNFLTLKVFTYPDR